MLGLATLLAAGTQSFVSPHNMDHIGPFTQFMPFSLFSDSRNTEDLPGVLRDADQYNSSTMTVQNDVRAPFGNNPYIPSIYFTDLMNSALYRNRYGQNIYDRQIRDPIDWRIDPAFRDNTNNYNNGYYSTEPIVHNILKYQGQNYQRHNVTKCNY